MLTSKQRSNLKAKASKIEPIMQIGKNGINESLIKSLHDALEARELIKLTVLNNCDDLTSALLNELCIKLHAEPVCAIGKKLIIYKKTSRKDIERMDINN